MSQANGATKKIVNPYAKKKATTTTSSSSSNRETRNVNNVHQSTRDAANFGDYSGGTFSQAFSSVEETVHYQAELASRLPLEGATAATTAEATEARAQQRAFDTEAAREEAARLEARDQHALLQPHVLYVSFKQRGNGLLKHIRNVPVKFSSMLPDYIFSKYGCALFLSIKYHNLYPNYIHGRIAELKTDFKTRVLLVLVDVEDNASALLGLNRLAVVHGLALLLAWSEEEAARYLETFKALEGRDPSSIQKREQAAFVDQAADFLTAGRRSVNKTDAAQLLSQFSSIKQLVAASEEELSLCPGLGEKKVKRLWDALHKPFSRKAAKKRKESKERQGEEMEEKDKSLSDAEEEGNSAEKTKAKSNHELATTTNQAEMTMV